MLMYQKKLVEFQIGKDNNNNNTIVGQQSSSSSDLSIKIPSCFLQSSSHKKQSTSTPPRLQIKIPHFSSTNSPRDNQNQNQNEPIFRNQSSTKTLVSFPHKRSSMISQTPSFGQPETSGSHYYHQKASVLNSDSSSYHSSFLCSPSSPVFLATKRITLKFIHNSCHASWFRVHLKVFILISLPSVYLLTLTRHWPFLIHFLYVLAFSALLVIALNYLALPRLPSIRLFLARILCIKLTPPKHHHPPVVWSIGTKPKPEKRPLSISGSWVQVYSNGDVYEGEFHKGKCSGSGVYHYHLSGRYEGDWVDEKYDGYGVETWAKGSRYRGQYRQGLRHGVGMYRSYTGDSYSGEWCNGQCHGVGMHTCEDGSSYFGEFKWGSKHGLGHYHFRNGDTYAGEYFADRMHGFGVYRFGNGHKYEGAWHEGRRQGFGTYTFRSGETQSGHWQNGVLSSSTVQGTLTGSSFAVDHAKVLHAVQEARRAAEKAAEVLNVDERVKRAVAAANKAATAARVAAVKAVQNQLHEYDDSNNFPLTVV